MAGDAAAGGATGAAGLVGIWVCDHVMPHDPDGRPVAGPVLEGRSTLAALAVATSCTTVGTLVLGATYRSAGLVAAMAATLQDLSGADAWHVWGPADRFTHKSEVLDQRCAEVGRDPGAIARVSGEVVDPGTPDDEVAALLAGYRDAGCDELVLRDHRDDDADAVARTVDQLVRLAAG